MSAHAIGSPRMRKAIAALTLMSALAVGACNFDLTNPNSPPPIGPNATPDQVKSAAVGLLVALRVDVTRWVLNNGILGREGYRLDTADPRFTTELLAGPLDPSNDAFGGGQWAAEFRAIQSGYAILNVIGSAQIPAGQQDAVRGFVHTMQAVAFLMILNSHTEDSIPIDVNRTINQPLAPFVSNDSAYKHVLSLLDSAKTELQAATAFSFDPGPGFVGFNTPATFLKVNRALAARVQAYRASPSAPGVGCTVLGQRPHEPCGVVHRRGRPARHRRVPRVQHGEPGCYQRLVAGSGVRDPARPSHGQGQRGGTEPQHPARPALPREGDGSEERDRHGAGYVFARVPQVGAGLDPLPDPELRDPDDPERGAIPPPCRGELVRGHWKRSEERRVGK